MKRGILMNALQKTAFAAAAVFFFSGAGNVLPVQNTVCAAEANVMDGMKYEEADGEITISGYTADLPKELEIPAEIGGYTVYEYIRLRRVQTAARCIRHGGDLAEATKKGCFRTYAGC